MCALLYIITSSDYVLRGFAGSGPVPSTLSALFYASLMLLKLSS